MTALASFTATVVEQTFTAADAGVTFTVALGAHITGAQGPAGQGVPTGGSSGQVLAKASSTNYDTEWVNQTGGGGGAGPDHAGFRIDDCAVDGTATSVQLLDDAGQPLGPPTGIIAGLRVFMVDVSGKTGYVTTASGAWTGVSSNAGETWLNLNPGTSGWYQGTNTAGFGGSVDDDAAATSIVILAPGVVTPADIDPFQFPALTPSVPVVLSAEEDIFSGTGDTLTLVANPPLVTRNGDLSSPVGGHSSDTLIYDGNPLYALSAGDVVIIRGGSHEGGYKLTGGEVGDEAVRLTDDDNIQGVLWGRLLHNRLIKVAEGPRGQRLAVVFAGDGLHSAREFAWLTANDITAPTTIELTRTHGKGEHDELVIALAGLGDFADAGGDAGKVLIVNDAGDGFELVTGGTGGGVQSVSVTGGITLGGTATDVILGLDYADVRTTVGVPDSTGQAASATLHPDGNGWAEWGDGVTSVDGAVGDVDLSGSYDPLGSAAAAITAHSGSTDPHGDRAYAAGLFAANDALVYKGVIDCSASPNYPAANAGETYRVSVAGKLGGSGGPAVEVGDMAICIADGTNAGTHAGVGASWDIIQTNIDGAVTGPTSATDGDIALFNGSTGKIIKAAGLTPTTDNMIQSVAGVWASRTPTQVKSALGLTSFATLATGTAGYVVGADATTFALGGVPLGTPSGGSQNYGVPGVAWSGVTANTAAANTISYLPFIATAPITVDRLVFECTTLNSGKSAVMGIYSATSAWQPTGAALADTGAVSVTTTGVKASTVSAALAPGRYLLAFFNEHSSTGIRFAVPTTPAVCEIDAATMGGTNNIVTAYRSASLTFVTSLPNTGPAWTSSKSTAATVFPLILMRWSLT